MDFKDAGETTMQTIRIVSLSAIVALLCPPVCGVYLFECDGNGCPTPLAIAEIEWVYSITETNLASNVFSLGRGDGDARFCREGMQFNVSILSNRLSTAVETMVDRRRSRGMNIRIAGLVGRKIDVSKDGRWLATATLYDEPSALFAREIAIRDFFMVSTTPTKSIAASIDVRVGEIGDYLLLWKPYSANTDHLTFVRGNVAVVIRSEKAAICVAKVIDKFLLECYRSESIGMPRPTH